MDMILTIEYWAFPAIDLVLMICSFTLIRHSGGILLGFGFAMTAIASASLPVSDLIAPASDDVEQFYNMVTHFSLLAYFVAAALIIIGLVQIGSAIQSE